MGEFIKIQNIFKPSKGEGADFAEHNAQIADFNSQIADFKAQIAEIKARYTNIAVSSIFLGIIVYLII